jgi:hypothetical protein
MLNVNFVDELRRQLEALNRDYPELADDEVLAADTFEAETDLYSALTALVAAQADTSTLMEALGGRIKTLSERLARLGRRSDGLRALMLKLLQSAELKKIELPDATLSQRFGQPQIIGEVDVEALPDDLIRIRREPNRAAIREALMGHRAVPGLHLSNAPPSLMIKVK